MALVAGWSAQICVELVVLSKTHLSPFQPCPKEPGPAETTVLPAKRCHTIRGCWVCLSLRVPLGQRETARTSTLLGNSSPASFFPPANCSPELGLWWIPFESVAHFFPLPGWFAPPQRSLGPARPRLPRGAQARCRWRGAGTPTPRRCPRSCGGSGPARTSRTEGLGRRRASDGVELVFEEGFFFYTPPSQKRRRKDTRSREKKSSGTWVCLQALKVTLVTFPKGDGSCSWMGGSFFSFRGFLRGFGFPQRKEN